MSQIALKTAAEPQNPQNSGTKGDSFEAQEILSLVQSFPPLADLPESKNLSSSLHWLARSQGNKVSASLNYPRIALFAGRHGFAPENEKDPAFSYLKGCVEGTLRLSRLAKSANTDLRLYELDLEAGTQNCLGASPCPAMTETEMVRTMAYGMMIVEPEIDLIATGGFGPGSRESAEALIAIHTQKTAAGPNQNNPLIAAAKGARGLAALRQIGGHELSAVCGVIIAARLACIPVLLEGLAGLAALLVLREENPNITGHCALCGINEEEEAFQDLLYLESPYPFPQEEPGVALAALISHLRMELLLDDPQ